ncbi:MAG TPA: UPF0175 family protein [Tepidisphaeraceae bacterium]|jgi:hypothetical protein|nr:UPF0175 family protein [Tepidisphaeraceae bacterium]
MAVSFELPRDIEKSLREEVGDLGQAAKEALLVELYRQERLTQDELAKALGISWYESEGVLKRHEVFHEITAADVVRESEEIRQLRDKDACRR